MPEYEYQGKVEPKPRDPEVEAEQHAEFAAAMQQVAGFAITESAKLTGGEVSVSFGDTAPSEHDQLGIRDLMKIYECGYSKAQRLINAIPGVTKVGNKKVILRSQLEEYIRVHGDLKADWNKGKGRRGTKSNKPRKSAGE